MKYFRLTKRFWFATLIIFTIGVFLVDRMSSQSHISGENSSIASLTEKAFNEKLQSEPGTICVLFYMPQSPDYPVMENNLHKIKSNGQTRIPMYKLNVEEYPEPFFDQRLSGTPTLVFYKDGKRTGQAMGRVSTTNINHIIKHLI